MRSFLLALALAVLFIASPVRAQSLVFVADMDFAPYSMLSEGKAAGIDVEAVAEAARRSGLDITILLRPWDEMVSMLKSGECDGAFSFFRNPEREQYATFLEAAPIHYSDYVFFTKVGDKFSFRSYDDLAGKTVGRVKGTALGDEFEAAAAAGVMTLREYPDRAAALGGLIGDEINAFADNIDATYNRLKTMGMTSSIVYLPKKIISQKPAYVVLSRASAHPGKAEAGQRIERALDQMRKDGTYNAIAHRYLLRF
jgi:ABC-type amino acid transport/signal transduction systems, periplasmic component/domain